MEKFIPREKLGKKAKKELYLKQRRTWGALKPVTRSPENPKAYNRKKAQQEDDFHPEVEPFYILGFVNRQRLLTTFDKGSTMKASSL